jgi:capsular polysaccharide transport system permease protein
MNPMDAPPTILLPALPTVSGPVSVWARLTPKLLLLGLVLAPMLLGLLYFFTLAQDRYVSTSVITVRRASQDAASASGLAMLLSGTGSASTEDVRYLRDYVHSLGLLRKLDAELDLRAHYEQAPRDPFYRLWPDSSQEWMLEYWRSRVSVDLHEMSGLLTLRVQGFEPDYAQRINRALLRESESFVNEISQRIARDQMAFVQGELDRAAQALQAARTAVMAFQTEHEILDPIGQAQAAGVLTAELRAQLAKVEAELRTKLTYLNTDAPDIVALKAQAQALRLQAQQEARGATQPKPGALNRLAVEYQELRTKATFAEDAYKTALTVVERTRLETSQKLKSLVVIEPPTRAETAEYPRRLYSLFSLLVACLLVYTAVRLTVATINEHRD